MDVRGNPGGSFEAALKCADEFSGGGYLATLTGRDPSYDGRIAGTTGGKGVGYPAVVLTDSGTASSAEVFTVAMRGFSFLSVGGRTAGKGSVQIVVDGKLRTVAEFYDHEGNPVERSGILPDIAAHGDLALEVGAAEILKAIKKEAR